ncbi:MAG: DUF2155 domain-containing protein [Rhodospirillales bacterium]|nr:DUF2155 domain-containing protein [Rhodospirillales bacterium]
MRRVLLAALSPLLAIAAVARADPYPVAVLRALDKVTARVTTLRAPVGTPVHFGALEITTEVCDKRPPEEPPEAAAFLKIIETRAEQPAVEVFHGWMFASSPGVSALQHPVYDIWVLDCENSAENTESSASGGGSP